MAMLMASVMQVSAGRFIDVDEVVGLWVAHIDTFIHMVEFLAVKGDAVADVDGFAEPALLGFFQLLHQKAQQAFDTPRLRSSMGAEFLGHAHDDTWTSTPVPAAPNGTDRHQYGADSPASCGYQNRDREAPLPPVSPKEYP